MSRMRQAIAPAYLFACIVLGGSAQGVFSNLALQLAAIAISAWALLTRVKAQKSRPARHLMWLAGASAALVLLQLVPLPPAIWSHFPGRQLVADGYRLLGQPLPWMPLSLAPAHTIAAAMSLLPPLAMLALILRLGAYRGDWLVFALLLGAFISVALGVMQIQGSGEDYYLYPLKNLGTASGLFANSNHQATLLLVSIPFLVALGARRWRKSPKPADRLLTAMFAGGAAIVLLVGVSTNQSFALLIIGAPVIGAAALQLIPPGRVRLGRLAAMLGILFLAGTAALAIMLSAGLSASDRTSVTMRGDIWSHSARVIGNFGVAGSGIGTFPSVYPLVEQPETASRTYINHAHNDYLETVIEGGLAGLVLVLLFLAWWGARAFAIWRSTDSAELARAACIASAAILLHSLVDYPLRTAAIASIMAMAIALMAGPGRRREEALAEERRPTRHLTL